MLYCGERIGHPTFTPKIDIAVDPLDGTTLTAQVRCRAAQGCHAPAACPAPPRPAAGMQLPRAHCARACRGVLAR